jgi:outer membrane protein OmpA-like peptidoglycan-associated protein
MKRFQNVSKLTLALAITAFVATSCKSKKPLVEPTPEVTTQAPPPAPAPPAKVEEKEEAPAPVETPDFKYDNVQFEFNSSVLKTASYATLDQMGQEMKKYPEVKFVLNGHASIEGSDEHNMTLSVDRANSVKAYLVNMGVPVENLETKAFGSSQPVSSNDTEEGRARNRRVEITKK